MLAIMDEPDTRTEWMIAYDLYTGLVAEHPDFPRLVREVAVAEQPSGPPSWLQEMGGGLHWLFRGTEGSWARQGRPGDRAWALTRELAEAIGVPEGWQPREWEATCYVLAKKYVDRRKSGLHPVDVFAE
jgi:hypothetical protein